MSFEENSIGQIDAKRMHNETSDDDHIDGDIDLEEGEIEDDDELLQAQLQQSLNKDEIDNRSLSSTTSDKSNAKQRKHRKRNRKKNRDKKKQRKNRVAYVDLDKVEQQDESSLGSEEPPSKQILTLDSQKPMISLATPLPNIPQITPVMLNPLVAQAPLILPQITQTTLNPLVGLQTQQNAVKSLLDLITISAASNSRPSNIPAASTLQQASLHSTSLSTGSFVDPVLIEKENNKPNLALNLLQASNQQKRKREDTTNKQQQLNITAQQQASHHTESMSKKQEKKRKYLELMKEKQKREAERKEKSESKEKTVVCKFYLEGRCQKGDECTFSHNAKPNKKYEICKYYLNGYCSKNEQCVYMHSDFPCKFYHSGKGECAHAETCRFSHEPIIDSQIREAFDKYLKDTQPTQQINIEIPGPNNNKTSILGSPPRHLKAEVEKRFQTTQQQQQQQQPLATQSQIPLVLQTQNQFKPNLASLQSTKPNYAVPNFAQDVDERAPIVPFQAGDIDERVVNVTQDQQSQSILKLFNQQHEQQLPKPSNLNDLLSNLVAMPKTETLSKQDEQDIVYDNDYDDDYEDNTLNIDECNEINGLDIPEDYEYNLPVIDVLPSILWSKPPMHSSFTNSNAECDPRVEFYSNKANNPLNDLNRQSNQLQSNILINNINDGLQSAMSPPSNDNFSYPVKSTLKQQTITAQKTKVDPRLSAKQQKTELQTTESISNGASTNDLLQLLTRQQNSLISSLPDFKAPLNDQRLQNKTNEFSIQTHTTHETNHTRLSIDDYKRKLSKTNQSLSLSNEQTTLTQTNAAPSYAAIPSYSLNLVDSLTSDLKPPQSLHEILKNFPS